MRLLPVSTRGRLNDGRLFDDLVRQQFHSQLLGDGLVAIDVDEEYAIGPDGTDLDAQFSDLPGNAFAGKVVGFTRGYVYAKYHPGIL